MQMVESGRVFSGCVDEGIVNLWQEAFFSVHGFFLRVNVPSLQGTSIESDHFSASVVTKITS